MTPRILRDVGSTYLRDDTYDLPAPSLSDGSELCACRLAHLLPPAAAATDRVDVRCASGAREPHRHADPAGLCDGPAALRAPRRWCSGTHAGFTGHHRECGGAYRLRSRTVVRHPDHM